MISFLSACVVQGVPLLFATLGEILHEKAGHLNLGVEGLMFMGAIMGFTVGLSTQSPYLAILAALAAGGFGSLIYAILTVTLRADQNVTGLTLTIFGTGFASFKGQSVMGCVSSPAITEFFRPKAIPGLSEIPVIGPILFDQNVLIYLGYIVVILLSIYLYKTKWGLNLRAVGENAASADASGINVTLYKYVHIIVGGALCGLGGAYMSLVTVPIWQDNIIAGRGWIAVALVIFATWNPTKAWFCSVFFGGLSILGLRLQSIGFGISQYLIDMVPYIATIIIIIISTRKNKKENLPPANLGQSYFREDR